MGTIAKGERIIFEPNPGPQTALLSCPIEEIFYGGARGGGKTYGFLGDWLAHAYEYGKHARGIFFRRTIDELDEVRRIATLLFLPLGAQYRAQKRTWFFPNGATLKLRFLNRDSDADKYQGHSYTWMAFDELTNWASLAPLDKLRACLRSGEAAIPKSLRLSGNPGGVGHNQVKARYIDPAPPFTPIYDPILDNWRVFIPSKLDDNQQLLKNDPDYWKRVVASANGDQALIKAWRWGEWDIAAGGMFDDVWDRSKHVIKPFEIPSSWRIDRSFDWGSSAPASVGFWAESDGTEATLADGTKRTFPRGTLFRIDEWYISTGGPKFEGLRLLASEIVTGYKDKATGEDVPGILDRQKRWADRIMPGPADTSIFDVENGMSIAADMQRAGVRWTRADKSPGSRKTGWQKLRAYLKAATESPMEKPGLFVFEHCLDWIRTIPVLPRDAKDRDDVDTKAEDHAADETRYRLLSGRKGSAY
ncbi:large subunit terminase [Bacteriophage sp.]|nr:large subunit terminase [Bacteriophage sp.]